MKIVENKLVSYRIFVCRNNEAFVTCAHASSIFEYLKLCCKHIAYKNICTCAGAHSQVLQTHMEMLAPSLVPSICDLFSRSSLT